MTKEEPRSFSALAAWPQPLHTPKTTKKPQSHALTNTWNIKMNSDIKDCFFFLPKSAHMKDTAVVSCQGSWPLHFLGTLV